MLNLKLMLVEDDDELRERLGKILTRKISAVFLFANPMEALEKFEEINPDIVLTDVKMPQMSGLELIGAIRQIKPETPIILASAFSHSSYFQQAIRLKVEHFLIKPIDVDELISEFRRIMDNVNLDLKFTTQEKLVAQYKRIVDVSCLVSKADIHGKITYVNEKFSQLSGYSKKELIGEPHNIVRHPDVPSLFFKNIWETILNKEIWQGIIKNRAKNGQSYYVETTIAPVLDERNNIIEFISLREDVTKLIGAIEDAQRLEKEKKDYLALIDDNIISSSTDLNGVITSVSTAFCRMSQYAPQELLGQSYHLLRDPQTSQKFYESLWQTITKNEKWNGEIKNVAKDKTSYWVFASITPIMNSEGIKIGYTAIEQNITDKKIVEELAIRDHLTGLVNRSRLDAIFEYEIPQSLRYKTPLSIIMIDIDYFKSVNDTYGHLVGDLVLQELSAILKIDKREADTVGRWGGEEFLIILPQTDINGARTRAEKIRLATQSHIFASVGSQTVSLGIAQLEQNDTDASFVGRADSALYKAKNMGRNRVMG